MAKAKKPPARASVKRVVKDKTGATYRMHIVLQGVTLNRKPLPADVAAELIAGGIERLVGGLVLTDIKAKVRKP